MSRSTSSSTRPMMSSHTGPLPSVLAPVPFFVNRSPTTDTSSFSNQPYNPWQNSSAPSSTYYTPSYPPIPQPLISSPGTALPPALETNPYAHLYTSNVPDLPSANGTGSGSRHPIVGRRQRVSVACTYCRRRWVFVLSVSSHHLTPFRPTGRSDAAAPKSAPTANAPVVNANTRQ
jgi:hypothetical protein